MPHPNTHIVKTSVFSDRLLLALGDEHVFLNKLLRRHPLKNFDLTDPEGYVPLSLLCEFMLEVDRYLGPSSVCTLLSDHGKNYKLGELGNYGRHVMSVPHLLAFIQKAIKHEKTISTDLSSTFQILGNKAMYSNICTSPSMPGKELWEAIVITVVLDSFRSFCGYNWVPLEIQLPNKPTKNIEKVLPQGDYHLSWGHPHFAIIFPVEILTQLPPAPPRLVGQLELERVEEKLAYRTEKLLLNYQPGQRASMTDLSDYFNLSTRSIRRYLLEEGTTFSKIQDRVVFMLALDLLANTTWEVKEISEYLGYNEPANFNRFFKKRTGVSPGKFREMPHSN